MLEDEDGLIVIDPKHVIKPGNVDWRQLIWYSLGLEPHFQKPVKTAAFLMTFLKKWSPRNPRGMHSPGVTYRDKLNAEILETALKIRREPFQAKVSRHICPRCPVQDFCPEYQDYARRSQALLGDLVAMGDGLTEF